MDTVMTQEWPPIEQILQDWVSVDDAIDLIAENNGGRRLTAAGVRYLANAQRIRAKQIGRIWYLDPEECRNYEMINRPARDGEMDS